MKDEQYSHLNQLGIKVKSAKQGVKDSGFVNPTLPTLAKGWVKQVLTKSGEVLSHMDIKALESGLTDKPMINKELGQECQASLSNENKNTEKQQLEGLQNLQIQAEQLELFEHEQLTMPMIASSQWELKWIGLLDQEQSQTQQEYQMQENRVVDPLKEIENMPIDPIEQLRLATELEYVKAFLFEQIPSDLMQQWRQELSAVQVKSSLLSAYIEEKQAAVILELLAVSVKHQLSVEQLTTVPQLLKSYQIKHDLAHQMVQEHMIKSWLSASEQTRTELGVLINALALLWQDQIKEHVQNNLEKTLGLLGTKNNSVAKEFDYLMNQEDAINEVPVNNEMIENPYEPEQVNDEQMNVVADDLQSDFLADEQRNPIKNFKKINDPLGQIAASTESELSPKAYYIPLPVDPIKGFKKIN